MAYITGIGQIWNCWESLNSQVTNPLPSFLTMNQSIFLRKVHVIFALKDVQQEMHCVCTSLEIIGMRVFNIEY